ncbi:hypothetical protein [Candidatus Hodarchaeum mangrovi]
MTHVANLMVENPFHNFTARADIPELFNLNRPNKEALNQVIRFLDIIRKKKRESVILPIIAEAGFGKTHFYWVLRETINDAYVVYIPVPSNPKRIYSHFYFETVKAGGAPLLEYIADFLTSKYSKVEHAAVDYSGLGNIVLDAFFALKNQKQSKIALKWLTGFDLDEETTQFKRTIMDDEELAFAALKIILKIIDKPIIFFVDELESLFISLGPEAELQFLENLKKMFNEASNFLMCLSCLATLWDKLLDLSSSAVQGRIEPPVVLKRFTKKDIEHYCIHMLEEFHHKFEVHISEPNILWPLKDSDIESAYAYSHGNPREAIKWLNGIIEERKEPILDSIRKNNEYLSETGKKVKIAIEKVKKIGTGVFQKHNGIFISLNIPDKKILTIIPPLKDIDEFLLHSYWSALKKLLEEEEYSEIFVIGEVFKGFELNDVKIQAFHEKNLDSSFIETLKKSVS